MHFRKALLSLIAMMTVAGILGSAQVAAPKPRSDRPAVDQSGPDLRIWREFVALLRAGRLTADRIEPMEESLRVPLKGFLDQMAGSAHWAEWEAVPEVQRTGAKVNFILDLSFGEGPGTSYCFTFLERDASWAFHHLEAVFLRLDMTPPPPTSSFPDMDEERKAWDREEGYWSKIVHWYGVLVPEKGKEFFYGLIRDGDGYFVWAKSRVPFLPPHRAFILFLCWEQAHLRGQNLGGPGVTLEELTDEKALVRIVPIYFQLYRAAAHLKPQISFEDYRAIFETIWRDRARAAGWALDIEYKEVPSGLECVFRFKRPAS
jgi:hypothetical protein